MQSCTRIASFHHIRPSTSYNDGDDVQEPSKEKPKLPITSHAPVTSDDVKNHGIQKRRQESTTESFVMIENELMQLCRAKDWASVIRRVRSCPEEAIPRRIHDDRQFSKRCISGAPFYLSAGASKTLCYETPLGLACASREIDSPLLHEVIIALIMASPDQIRASQLIPGHTPLRDAILNDRCDGVVLRALLDADIICDKTLGPVTSALGMKDRNGHLPLDHLMMGVQLGSSPNSLDRFKTYVEHAAYSRISMDSDYSPLVRLYTMASSSDLGMEENDDDIQQRRRVLKATKFLLERDPSILLKYSSLTGCSPLHAALRNFGDCLPLIHILTSRPESKTLLAHRNRFGDLPVHVACSVGVPLEVLRVVVECTMSVSQPPKSESAFATHPLLWSMNTLGYSPIDLEWIRHVEGGHGFCSPRSVYPLNPSGSRKRGIQQDDYYHNLLRDAVNTILGPDTGSVTTTTKSKYDRQAKVENMFGSLLDRIGLLVTASAYAIPTTSSPTLLHNICKLSANGGRPPFPAPLVDLFSWLHRGQVLVKDQCGMIPLHYAINRQTTGTCARPTSAMSDPTMWKEHLLQLLHLEPESARISNHDGRLPLHIFLASVGDETTNDTAGVRDVIQELVQSFPESIDRPDPITGLDPFLLAATNPSLDLNVIYTLLRLSPARCIRSGLPNN